VGAGSCRARLKAASNERESAVLALLLLVAFSVVGDTSVASDHVPRSRESQAPTRAGVAVIAHSVSTSMIARDVRMRKGWAELPLREADFVLVVCRSTLSDPLDYSYPSLRELDEDAENQLNIAGDRAHVYLYEVNADRSVVRRKHDSFRADD